MKRPEGTTKADPSSAKRKPRVLIAGEFSAGKTQLINGLLGQMILPSNVTSTALPPVWIMQGGDAKSAVDLDGQVQERDGFDGISVSETLYCMLGSGSDFLDTVELIDTPGNSDPNIPSECWERMLDYADVVVWCTNATQAWRQSEKAVWDEMPGHLRANATLLITHADRLPDTRARDRVLRRTKREAGKYFDHFMLASLLDTDDLATVRAHILEMAETLDAFPGARNDTVKTFAEASRKRAVQADATPVKPRRVSAARRKADEAEAQDAPEAQTEEVAATPEAEAPKDAPAAPLVLTAPASEVGEEAVRTATILALNPAGADLSDAAGKGPSGGKARALWAEISDGVDVTDAQALLSCVERFIDQLDEADVSLEDDSDEDDAEVGSVHDQIQSLVSRSQV
ncbi:GTPase [Actibacterium ureilyticum]|uniref:GTPase n=1 Tax=Actibacterium ureilyticum TaxID=1590614 RepID=UPI00114097BA|nr:GTPase [Actibacterium ureilyticum]